MDVNPAHLIVWYLVFVFSTTCHEAAHALAALGEVRKAVLDAKKGQRADPAELELLLEDMAEAENAVARSAAERERARRTMRERSHITLLGQSTVRRLPTDDE